MKHDEFIELLNLYLDGELPPTRAAELEQEITGNPEHHRIYRQYCQMQNACAVLAERFRDEAAPAPHFRAGRVVELPQRVSGGWWKSVGLVASGAMAACAAFVLVRMAMPGTSPTNNGTPAVASAPAPVVPTTTASFDANPAAFSNPWSGANRFVSYETANLQSLETKDLPVDLAVPELKLRVGPNGELLPYGKAPNEMLGLDEIQAAAFQFQR